MTDDQFERLVQLMIHCFAVLAWANEHTVTPDVVRENLQLAWQRIKVGR